MANLAPLRDFIAKYESGGNYNIVWGGIALTHRPPRALTSMTIGEVLDWQEGIDHLYQSEAAGRYQIMEDTLREIYRRAGYTLKSRFNEATQDGLANYLIKRRGLNNYLEGDKSASDFANSLAYEWASLPIVAHEDRSKIGRSQYAGDGLNKAHAPVAGFLFVVEAVKGGPVGKFDALWGLLRRLKARE